MNRMVVAFQAMFDGSLQVMLDDAPTDIPNLGVPDGFVIPDDDDGAAPADRGAALVAALRKHVAIKAGLDSVLSAPPESAATPLYFHVRAAAADRLPWEQIWVDGPTGFCALDRRWPVVRIADRERELKVRDFVPPFRIVAVLAAAGQSGLEQLDGLLGAVATPQAAAVDASLHVISGEQAVLDTARAAGATAEFVGSDPVTVAGQITAGNPDLLHVLCHGGAAAAGVRMLSFAHLGDVTARSRVGSVRLAVPALLDALQPCEPWLVVLSACSTAAAVAGDAERTLAHDLVSGGIPAVVGMRRLVDITKADRFCAALYPEVLHTVATALGDRVGPPVARPVSWAEALTGPRNVLSGGNPPAGDDWTDPVLYVQAGRLQVQPSMPASAPASLSAEQRAALRGKLDKFRGFVATLDPATTDAAVLDAALARIAELEGQLAS